MSRFIAAIAAACIFLSTVPALAAATGIVRGVITQGGTPQAGATITLAGEGSLFTAKTEKDGSYSFGTVPFGHYVLTAHASGATARSADVDVHSDAVAVIDLDLLKTIAVTSVTATAGVGGTPVGSTTIDKSQIQTSPVRDSLDRLIETVPGVVQFSYNEPVINGFHGVTYQIDGAPLPLATTSNFAEIIDPRSIDSIEVLTGAIPAEYGGDRIGGVVNIITDRFEDIPEGTYGTITGGAGSQSQIVGQFDTVSRFGNNELFVSVNNASTGRGIDAPTLNAVHDDSSSSDQFIRWVSKLNDRSTIAFDYGNQFSQYQIPINPCDPATQGGVDGCATLNPNDPIFDLPGTDDVQLEYDQFANLNFTQTSKDGNSVFQLIPWYRSTRVNYDGDLAADVQGYQPNFSCVPSGDPDNYPDCNSDGVTPNYLNNVGLNQVTNANYLGLRISELHSSERHTWKVGIDASRENATGSETFACYYEDCAVPVTGATVTGPSPTGYYAYPLSSSHAGSQIGIYAQDKWLISQLIDLDYGVRYDHSTGYVGGDMIEPRIGLNISDGGKNIVHFFYGRYYAAPLLEDVRGACSIFAAQSAEGTGNAGCATTTPAYDLQPENDSYVEMGIQHTFNSHLTGWANLFEKNVVNVLDTTELLNTPLFAVYNNAIGHNQGLEIRLQDRDRYGNDWFLTSTISGSYAGGISGSTFLFPVDVNAGLPISSPAQLSLEDHSQTVDSTAGYTAHFGADHAWFATLQGDYGSGFPVQFQNVNGASLNGTLPAHTTLDLSAGRIVLAGKGPQSQGLGITLDVLNLLNHQYVIKVANGFNTTQFANGRTFLVRVTAPF
ncbi:MAG TPA: TonB-dependent receptor [Candidatus Acidoferrales bacterium]|nr:TonB-dependent receptor [Candidatus Acidoferrales bacterium]